MRTFIQLKNNIGFATINVADGEPDHTVTPDDTTSIEVFTSDPDQFLKKKYDLETNSWSDAPLYVYAELNNVGEIIEIKRTVFIHEVSGPLYTEECSPSSRWINNEWVHTLLPQIESNVVGPAEITVLPVPESDQVNESDQTLN